MRHQIASFQLVTLVTYVKYLNSDIWKKGNGERARRIRLNKGFKVESRDMNYANSIQVHVCMYVWMCVCFLQTRFSKIFNVFRWLRNSAGYLFQNKRPRLSNTQPNNRLRFWSLQRKSKIWVQYLKNLAICLSYNAWLSYVFFQSNTVHFWPRIYFVSIFVFIC